MSFTTKSTGEVTLETIDGVDYYVFTVVHHIPVAIESLVNSKPMKKKRARKTQRRGKKAEKVGHDETPEEDVEVDEPTTTTLADIKPPTTKAVFGTSISEFRNMLIRLDQDKPMTTAVFIAGFYNKFSAMFHTYTDIPNFIMECISDSDETVRNNTHIYRTLRDFVINAEIAAFDEISRSGKAVTYASQRARGRNYVKKHNKIDFVESTEALLEMFKRVLDMYTSNDIDIPDVYTIAHMGESSAEENTEEVKSVELEHDDTVNTIYETALSRDNIKLPAGAKKEYNAKESSTFDNTKPIEEDDSNESSSSDYTPPEPVTKMVVGDTSPHFDN